MTSSMSSGTSTPPRHRTARHPCRDRLGGDLTPRPRRRSRVAGGPRPARGRGPAGAHGAARGESTWASSRSATVAGASASGVRPGGGRRSAGPQRPTDGAAGIRGRAGCRGDRAAEPAAPARTGLGDLAGGRLLHPRPGARRRGPVVASGDLLGWVDVLGVRQEVVAPVDGLVGRCSPGRATRWSTARSWSARGRRREARRIGPDGTTPDVQPRCRRRAGSG